MKISSESSLHAKFQNNGFSFPLLGYLELTYRCNFDCLHCYCKGSENQSQEISTNEIKTILDALQKEGCLWLILTGGEPFIRHDFKEIYSYAKQKGFIISIFSNGFAFTDDLISFLAQSPPESVEITLNGITARTYETITQKKGSFPIVLEAIKKLKRRGINLLLKANCLTLNKHEIGKIKQWTEKLLGSPRKNCYYFRYDRILYPRLNGDTTPCQYRLNADEFVQVGLLDRDMARECRENLVRQIPRLPRKREYLYQCNAWRKQFFINPYGRLRFCSFTDDYSVDLRTTPFREGFYRVFPKLMRERFKTDSACKKCTARSVCASCPAKAQLECGDKESPVVYHCAVAQAITKHELSLGALT